jgi:hypothetical protein
MKEYAVRDLEEIKGINKKIGKGLKEGNAK